MVNFCGNCGVKLNENDTACPNCGWAVPPSDPLSVPPVPDVNPTPSSDTLPPTDSPASDSPASASTTPSADLATPDKVKRANFFFWLILGVYLVPFILSALFEFLNHLFNGNFPISIPTWVPSLSALAALILVIYARVTFKFSKRIRVLFWVIIGLLIFEVVSVVFIGLFLALLVTALF